MRSSSGTAGLLVCILLAGAASSACGQEIGRAGAVNPVSTGTPPGAETRALAGGSEVVFKERIRTSQSGGLQVLFRDASTLKVGPRSDLVIDAFVYDPNAGPGEFAASITRGSFRFITGSVRGQAITIRTPSATIGIRG